MKRRDVLKSLALLPFAGRVLPNESLAATPVVKERVPALAQPQESSLHHRSFVMDGHVHVMSRQLLEGLDIGQRYSDGTVDLPRAIEGGLDAMFFSVYSEEDYYPGRHEVKNTFRLVELALEQIEKNHDVIELALTASDIEHINSRGKMAAFLDLEGAFDLDGDILLLRALYRLGLRSVQLTAHNMTNAFIDTSSGVRKWSGLNELGRTIIAEMNRLGMVINVAHASDEGIYQAVAASHHPVIYSHGGFRGIVDHPRCITDENANALAAKGGVIGIQFGNTFNNPEFSEWVSKNPPPPTPGAPNMKTDPSLSIAEVDSQVAEGLPFTFREKIPDEYWMGVDQLARVIDYGVHLVGEDHVALGSDFDGGPALPREIKDISDYPQITMAIQRLGYSDQRIKKILGLNWLRVIRQVTEES